MSDQFPQNTVIVVTTCDESAQRTVGLLADSGFSVIGPVDRAAVALALAAQTPIDLAVVHGRPGGRRDGPELAEDLMRAWGAPTIIVDDDRPGDQLWSARCALSDRVRAVLSGAGQPVA